MELHPGIQMNHGNRDPRLDRLRGAALASMIVYHGCWDLVYLLGFDWNWYRGIGAYLWQQSICWTFILLSGYCWPLSRRPLRRGLITLSAGFLVWGVTAAAVPQAVLRFGVLTLLGASALLMIPAEKLLRVIPWKAGLALHFALFLIFRNAASGWLGVGLGGKLGGVPLLMLPEGWYEYGLFSAWLGFRPEGFASADYFPILPWWFLFCCGYFLRRRNEAGAGGGFGSDRAMPESGVSDHGWAVSESGAFALGTSSLNGVLEWMGRRSLLVYLLHQPALYGAVVILDFVMRWRA